MLTRRGGDFYWLVCDACKAPEKLLKWEPGAMFGARDLAAMLVEVRCDKEGWKASPDGKKHVCPGCILSAEEEKRARRRHVAI